MIRQIGLAAAVLVFASGCSEELHHGLTEQDANDILVLLQENAITPTKVREEGGNEPTYMVTVPKQDFATAARLMKEYSLPRPKTPGLGSFRENKGMIPTQTEERGMFLEAMGGEVDRALNKIDGVLDAKTIVMVPDTNDLTQPENKPANTASVLVKYRPNAGEKRAPPLSEEQIRRFVSTSLPDMKPENVTVILSEALPTQATASPESQMKDVLGIRVMSASANTLRIYATVAVLIIVALAALVIRQLLRGEAVPAKARARRNDG